MPVTQAVDEHLTARMAAVTARLARLCAAAQVLSAIDPQSGSLSELDTSFEAAGEAVRRFQLAIDGGEFRLAQAILARLEPKTASLQSALAEMDASCPAADFDRLLNASNVATADLLGSLVEYYALVCPRAPGAIEKLLLVARTLAVRDGVHGDDAAAIERVFHRRKLLGPTEHRSNALDAGMLEVATLLRRRILALKSVDGGEFRAIVNDIRRFREVMGEALLGREGLAQAVALDLALHRRREAVGRIRARTLVAVRHDLESVTRASLGEGCGPVEDGDPEALALLRRAEAEIREAVAGGTPPEQGFMLDVEEATAIGALSRGGGDASGGELVLRGVSCRAAIDILARRHARGSQPGVEPPPLPSPTALALILRAAEIESDLVDLIQKRVTSGDTVAAKSFTRTLHKLSRARLGLALLGHLPVTGRHSPSEEMAAAAESAADTGTMAKPKPEADWVCGDAGRTVRIPLNTPNPAAKPPAKPPVKQPVSTGVARVALTSAGEGTRRAVGARTRIHIACAAVAVLAAVFHLVRLGTGALLPPPPLVSPTSATAVPLASSALLGDTVVAVATLDWEKVSETQRQAWVHALWTDLVGYDRFLVLRHDGRRPLAISTSSGVWIPPLEGDLGKFPGAGN